MLVAQHLLAAIREHFWIISARRVVRKIASRCITCFRVKPHPIYPIMGNLPKERVNPAPPFQVSGLDCAGPFILRDRKGRGSKPYKAWICLFICMTTRAIHLEIATDLSTDSFLAALRRFCARRGKPTKLFSDNGTNFIGAKNEINALTNILRQSCQSITNFCSNQGIEWKFIPAHAPHFGDLWEAGVKFTKFHLKRVLGNASLIYEDFLTILNQVEAVLNSRPLYPASSDPKDLSPITPAHFLIGRPITSPPDPDLRDIKEARLNRFQRIPQHIWSRWSREYVADLQRTGKWFQNSVNLKVGTLVVIKDNNLPPLCWLMARVIDVHPGEDGIVRIVSLRTSKGIIKRAVATICPLPTEEFWRI
nr:unnamed protein product [Callosobruchus chinensis]